MADSTASSPFLHALGHIALSGGALGALYIVNQVLGTDLLNGVVPPFVLIVANAALSYAKNVLGEYVPKA